MNALFAHVLVLVRWLTITNPDTAECIQKAILAGDLFSHIASLVDLTPVDPHIDKVEQMQCSLAKYLSVVSANG